MVMIYKPVFHGTEMLTLTGNTDKLYKRLCLKGLPYPSLPIIRIRTLMLYLIEQTYHSISMLLENTK